MGFLDEKRTRVDQKIRSKEVLDHVEYARVMGQLGRPGQDQVGHGTPFHFGDAVYGPAEPLLEPLQAIAAGCELTRVQQRKR